MDLEWIRAYMPHGACFFWKPHILVPYVVGQGLTAFAYLVIPLEVAKSDLRESSLLATLLLSLFVLSCGVGHVLNVANVWLGVYAPEAAWHVLTGLVSLAAWLRLRHERVSWGVGS